VATTPRRMHISCPSSEFPMNPWGKEETCGSYGHSDKKSIKPGPRFPQREKKNVPQTYHIASHHIYQHEREK